MERREQGAGNGATEQPRGSSSGRSQKQKTRKSKRKNQSKMQDNQTDGETARQRGNERKACSGTDYLVDLDGTICQLVGPPRESTISPSSIPTQFIQPTPTNLKHQIHGSDRTHNLQKSDPLHNKCRSTSCTCGSDRREGSIECQLLGTTGL